VAATAGTANTGGGGGGGSYDYLVSNTFINPAAGGKGVVILRYLTDAGNRFNVTGGTKTTSGIYTIHTFNDTGSLVIS